MIERHDKVFVPVSVSIRLPELTENNGMASKVVPILINRETYSSENGARYWGDKEFVTFPSTPTSAYYTKDGWYTEWGDSLILSKGEEVTHWLEEKENVYVLTEDEFSKRLTFGELRRANIARLPQFKNSKGEPSHEKADGSDWSLAFD
jgi:hypothetical protein